MGSDNAYRGGIVGTLTQGSIVERCFATGRCEYKGSGYFNFSGIASICENSTIRRCAVGKLDKTSTDVRVFRLAREVKDASTLENNASIDSNSGTDDRNGKDGETVAVALFKQHYFEYTLGWNFDTVWQWDDKEDRPALRSVGVGTMSQQAKPAAQKANMTDLLTQQISTNIWL